MLRRPITLLFLLVFIIIVVIFGGRLFLKHLNGILPLLKSPEKDITNLLDEENVQEFGIPLTLPQDFSLSLFAKDLGSPRVLIRDPGGNLLTTITREGKVIALPDEDSNGKADREVVVVEGLNQPHGLAFGCFPLDVFGVEYDCKLYIAETDQVALYDYDRTTLQATGKKTILRLPFGGGHFTRTLLLTTIEGEQKLLVSIGSSCNVCNEEDNRRATVLIANPDGSDARVYARGLRNAVFMATHPVTGDIWVTEMGRDFLGDDIPPDEINILFDGGNFGWPVCYGKNIHDTKFDTNTYIRAPCTPPFETPSYVDIPAHSAPLGIAFVPEEGWPEDLWYDALVAYHGSWNRSVPTGYKIVRIVLDARGNYKRTEDFITGWLTQTGEILGRPAGVLTEPGGTIYISDDRAGVIYRVTYDKEPR